MEMIHKCTRSTESHFGPYFRDVAANCPQKSNLKVTCALDLCVMISNDIAIVAGV